MPFFDVFGRILEKDDQSLNLEDLGEERTSIKIHLDTLSPFVDFRSGSYSMSDLKKVKVTEDYLGLPESERGCQIEPFEECEVRNYIAKVKSQCGCTPWVLSNHTEKASHYLCIGDKLFRIACFFLKKKLL